MCLELLNAPPFSPASCLPCSVCCGVLISAWVNRNRLMTMVRLNQRNEVKGVRNQNDHLKEAKTFPRVAGEQQSWVITISRIITPRNKAFDPLLILEY